MNVFSIVNFLVKYHMSIPIEFVLRYSGISQISGRAQKIGAELQSIRIYAKSKTKDFRLSLETLGFSEELERSSVK